MSSGQASWLDFCANPPNCDWRWRRQGGRHEFRCTLCRGRWLDSGWWFLDKDGIGELRDWPKLSQSQQ